MVRWPEALRDVHDVARSRALTAADGDVRRLRVKVEDGVAVVYVVNSPDHPIPTPPQQPRRRAPQRRR